MAGNFNLYAKGILNKFPTYSVAHVTTGTVTVVTATITSGGAFVARSSRHGSVYSAYLDLWERLNDGQIGLVPSLTAAEITALTGVDDGVNVINNTRGRLEVSVGGVFRATAARFTVTGITASSTQTQGNGLLSGDLNIVATVATRNDVVTLPIAGAGLVAIVVNAGSKRLRIFPGTGNDLGAGMNSFVNLSSGSAIAFYAYDSTTWVAL